MNVNWRIIGLVSALFAIAINYRRDRAIVISVTALVIFIGGGWLIQLRGFPDWASTPMVLLMIGMIVWVVVLNTVDVVRWLRRKHSLQ